MVWGNDLGLLSRSGDESAPGQMVSFAEETAGTLVAGSRKQI